MTQFGARLWRFQPPVDYGPIRPWLQRARAFAAGIIAVVCLVGAAMGLPYAQIPATAALAVLGHAVLRGQKKGTPLETLVVDGLAVAVGVSAGDHGHIVWVAAVAYLIAASITFAGLPTLLGALSAFGIAVGVQPLLPHPEIVLPVGGELIVWLAVAVFLGGVALTLMAAASAVHQATKRHDEALGAERRAVEIKNEFVSMITHELRTPLTNIAGFAMTLQDTWNQLEQSETDEFLSIIVTEAEHLGGLVDDVLAIPRLEAGRLLLEVTDFALQPVAYRIAHLLFPASGDRSASVSIGGSVRVTADPNRVEQVFRNLLGNARKYGGDQVSVEAVRHGDEWVITVADNGPGVPPEHRERVFGAFEQVSSGHLRTETGFGLGLAVAQHLVEAMGGRIWYEPGFPVGARFSFSMPAAASPPMEIEAVA